MGVLYMPFFDLGEMSPGTLTVATSGESDLVIDLGSASAANMWADDDYGDPSQIFTHYHHTNLPGSEPEGAQRFRKFARAGFGVALQTRLRDAAALAIWPDPNGISVSFSPVTGLYTIGYSDVVSFTWSSSVGRKLMGFTGNRSGSSSYVATESPTYCINCALPDISEESLPYEPDGIANALSDDSGGTATIARTAAPLYKDWVQEFESKENTNRSATGEAVVYWNHQRLYEHCRQGFPFVLYGDDRVGDAYGAAQVFSLRNDGLSFTPARHTPGSGSQLKIPYRCIYEGVAS